MIRINLLGAEGRRTAPPVGAEESAPARRNAPTAIGGVVVMLTLVAVGVHYTWLQYQTTGLAAQLVAARSENHRLQDVKKQVEMLQARRDDLNSRIRVITQLGDAPSGPSPLLAAMGDAVNGGGDLWLTDLDATGPDLEVDGGSAGLDRIADFIGALNRSGNFGDVKLESSAERPGTATHPTFTFKLALRLSAAAATPAGVAAQPVAHK